MEFGVFDHLDRNDLPLRDYYESRLRIIEAYDRLGFHAYFVAEHHSTPIGTAPSPSVFLAAVAQRTERLRFGPMVYALPLYHPLRMIEEICMLDQMSRGRLDIGFGRGASPTELEYYGQDPEKAQAIYTEALEVILKGLTSRSLTHHGEHFHFDNVPMELAPFQQPHPPVWYGVHAPDSAARAARKGLQVVGLDPTPQITAAFDSFRAAWREAWGAKPLPLMGLGRFIVVADTDAAALTIARRAYPRWHESFTHLRRRHNRINVHPRPPTFEELHAVGQGVAGTPATVTAFLREQIKISGSNYVVGQYAFGDVTLDEALHSIELFARNVMPDLAGATAGAVSSWAASPARAVEINVLSGAAVEPGLVAAADVFRKRTGCNVVIAYATTPEMRHLVGAGAAPDVAIAPPALLDELAKSAKVDGTARVSLGRVGVGVV